MKKHLLILFFSLCASYGFAQNGPRLFLDIPAIYFTAPDVTQINNQMGLGAEAAFYVSTHHLMTRVGGGAALTADPKAQDFQKSMVTTPYVLFEAGGGLFRSNGNQCAKTHQSAFTAIAKAGLRYSFIQDKVTEGTENEEVNKLDFTVGAEFGFFYIRDAVRNMEVFVRGNYFTDAKVISADLGFRFFLKLNGRRY